MREGCVREGNRGCSCWKGGKSRMLVLEERGMCQGGKLRRSVLDDRRVCDGVKF